MYLLGERSIRKFIAEDLNDRMIFIGGPRQVGKTTLAKSFLQRKNQYFNWDDTTDRAVIKTHKFDVGLRTIVLDELHKYFRWRTLLKGLYDKYKSELSILVTGSARLDTLRKGGDSLFGRYRYFRLHPFALHELDSNCNRKATETLLQFGGFPEPLSSQSPRKYRLWKQERIARVVYQDLRDLDMVKDLSKIELLIDALPSKVGSPLSVQSLKEDLEVSPNTVSHWLLLLETIYYSFRILPYGTPKLRGIKKANKLYLWDWAELQDKGALFENFVASQLLYYCHFLEDVNGHAMELRFLRDSVGREIDFVVIKNKKPIFAVECKSGENQLSKHIPYFRERTPIPHFYQVHLGKSRFKDDRASVMPWEDFWKERVRELSAEP